MTERPWFLPDDNPIETPELWTPDGMVQVGSDNVGLVGETGEPAVSYKFEVNFTINGRRYPTAFSVVTTLDDSPAHVEDMAAAMAERELERMIIRDQQRSGQLRPDELDRAMKDEVAGCLRDFRAAAKRRGATTTKRVYHQGLGGMVN